MKKSFIILFLVFAVILTGCDAKKEGVKTEYFDFAATEIVESLKSCSIDMTANTIVESEEKNEKIYDYTSHSDSFTDIEGVSSSPIHYIFTCDDTTNKVSHILFFFDRNSGLAYFRYLLHLKSIAEYIDSNINWDDVSSAIAKGFDELDYAIYEAENFELHVSRNEEYFNASFYPIKNTKGEIKK